MSGEKLDEKEVLKNIEQLKYLFKLKEIIRYDCERNEKIRSESDAEHIFGMQIIAEHFLVLEDPEKKWDHEKIREMILYHEIAEIETGDINVHEKTDRDREHEKGMVPVAIGKIPESIRRRCESLLDEYEGQETIEAQFVKAIDKLEPNFHIFDINGKELCKLCGVTKEKNWNIKYDYIKRFPTMLQYLTVISEETQQRGYFVTQR